MTLRKAVTKIMENMKTQRNSLHRRFVNTGYPDHEFTRGQLAEVESGLFAVSTALEYPDSDKITPETQNQEKST